MTFLKPSQCALVIIDTQEKLVPLIPAERWNTIKRSLGLLAAFLKEASLPVLITEHYPQGLGSTVPEVKNLFPEATVLSKNHFGSCGHAAFVDWIRKTKKTHFILVGLESHVCVYLTAKGLKDLGYEVLVLADAVGASDDFYYSQGLDLMKAYGALVINAQSLVFEFMDHCQHSSFKNISSVLKNNKQSK